MISDDSSLSTSYQLPGTQRESPHARPDSAKLQTPGRGVSSSRRPNHVLRLGRGVLYTPSSLLRFQRFCSRRPQEAGRRRMDRNLSHVAYLSKRFCSPDMRMSQRRSLGFLSTRSEVDREIPITPIGVDTVNHQR